jgi:hypothetical protein
MSKTLEQMAKKYVEQASLEYEEAAGGYYGFIAGYQAAELKAKIEFAAKYDHKSPLQVIAAEYVKRRGTTGPLALLEENRFIDGYEAGLHASQSQWISVKDRLPEVGQRVLIYNPLEYVSIVMADYYNTTRPFFDHITLDDIHLSIYPDEDKQLYWMPLPKPPEAKE